ncbi:DUF1707 and DUF4190 domain-containing protein [Kitasatospora sp. NPDC017646]|uniref:DUF1707 and DUF4190 domain-containing protein n=1 Tax=Kitasatospora sp. NPDC017646 TaxID=3364024 RepID=UPI0037B4C4D0
MSVQPWGESGPAHRHGHRPGGAGWQPAPSPQAAMRASHADRDRTVDVLKAGFAEGRLSAQEYEQRHEAAARALTYGELVALVADLPTGPMAAPLQSAQPVPATFLVPPPVPQARPTNVLAVVSLVCGLTGFLALPALPAVITGHIARSQIRERNMDGDWAAVLGLVLGYLGTAFWALLFLLAVA